jgi:hypothetical protein
LLLCDQPQKPVVSIEEIEEELSRRGGWCPLMHLFPHPGQYPDVVLPWSNADKRLQDWMLSSNIYQEAIAESFSATRQKSKLLVDPPTNIGSIHGQHEGGEMCNT